MYSGHSTTSLGEDLVPEQAHEAEEAHERGPDPARAAIVDVAVGSLPRH